MNRKILASVGCLTLSLLSPAFAADLPIKALPPELPYVAPYYDWTGFYIGVNGGYIWGNSKWWGGGFGSFSSAPRGFLGGGTLGFNYQTGAWVLGVEGDIDYANAKHTSLTAVCAGCTFKDTWLSTIRGRVGYAFDRWLPYVTGGGAWGDVYVSTPGGTIHKTKGGWTAGAGVEWAFAGSWSAKLEYLYADLGKATCSSATCILPTNLNVNFTANMVRAGINYRF